MCGHDGSEVEVAQGSPYPLGAVTRGACAGHAICKLKPARTRPIFGRLRPGPPEETPATNPPRVSQHLLSRRSTQPMSRAPRPPPTTPDKGPGAQVLVQRLQQRCRATGATPPDVPTRSRRRFPTELVTSRCGLQARGGLASQGDRNTVTNGKGQVVRQIWMGPGQFWSSSGHAWSNWAGFGDMCRIRSNFHQCLAKCGRFRPEIGRFLADVGRSRSNSFQI